MNDTSTGVGLDATEPSFAGFEPPPQPAAASPYRVLARNTGRVLSTT
jgi:hypothetical protein